MNSNVNSNEVFSKEELIEAQKNKQDTIVLTGELAEKFYNSQKIIKKGKIAAIATLSAAGIAVLSTPITGPVGPTAAAAFTASTGIGVSAIIAVSFFGLAALLAIHKNYDTVIMSKDGVTLKRK